MFPLAIGAYAVWRGRIEDVRHNVRIVVLTSCLILAGGLFFRLAVVLAGQLNPVFVTLP